jgi:hypothetical protein
MDEGEVAADDGGRWLTYDEIGKLRRISRSSAERLVRRRRWRRQTDNRGHAMAYVPGDWLEPPPPPDARPDARRGARRDISPAITAVFDAALGALREAHDRERAGWSEERTRLVAEIKAAQDQAEAAQIAQGEAEADAAELRQAIDASRGLGRWARIRAAWRGA